MSEHCRLTHHPAMLFAVVMLCLTDGAFGQDVPQARDSAVLAGLNDLGVTLQLWHDQRAHEEAFMQAQQLKLATRFVGPGTPEEKVIEAQREVDDMVINDAPFINHQLDLVKQERYETARRNLLRRATKVERKLATLEQLRVVARSAESEDHSRVKEHAVQYIEQLRKEAQLIVPTYVRGGFLPVGFGSTIDAVCFWGRDSKTFMPGFNLTGKGGAAAAAVNFYQDYAWGVQVGFGTAVSADENGDSVESNVQRFLSGGGNGIVNFAFPLLSVSTQERCDYGQPKPTGSLSPPQTAASLEVITSPKIGFDIPALGTQTQTTTLNIDLGGEIKGSILTANRVIRIYGTARAGYVAGTRAFRDGIGLDTTITTFGYVQGTLGFEILGVFRFGWSNPIIGPQSIRDHFKNVFSISLARPKS